LSGPIQKCGTGRILQLVATPCQVAEADSPAGPVAPGHRFYKSPDDGIEAIRKGYSYWTEKLTDTSLQLSFAVIAANWAVFGSVNAIRQNAWSEASIALVLAGLGLSVVCAWWLGELCRKQLRHALDDSVHWQSEFEVSTQVGNPWPFTHWIQNLGLVMRVAKTVLPLLAGVLFIVALILAPTV